MCSRRMGFGVKERCPSVDELSVIARAAATPAPHLVTAAVPRDLRVDPCEEKSKETSLAVYDKGALLVVGVNLVNMTAATFYSGNAAAKFAKMCTSG